MATRKVKGRLSPKPKTPKGREKKLKLTLPTKPTKPRSELGDYSLLIYGEKKIGKTTLAARFPGHFVLAFEPGTKHIETWERSVNRWDAFVGYIDLLERTEHEFGTIIVDTADRAYRMCMEHVCKRKLHIDHPSEADWGRGWDAVRDEFTFQINRLVSLGMGVIFISHGGDKEIRTRTGGSYHRTQPTMAGQARDTLEAIVDIWCYYDYQDGHRFLTLRGDDHISAGVRPGQNFRYTDGKPIKRLYMGRSEEEAYNRFVRAFNNEIERDDNRAPTPKTKKKKRSKVRRKG